MTHARLAALPARRAREELEQSRRALEEQLGVTVDSLAYPAGSYDPQVLDLAAVAGYRVGFTTETGAVRPGSPPLALRRIGVWGGGYRGTRSRFSPSVFGFQLARLARR
jgi:peptidoglycan/xylan/chitin deacetylase (PgdA/CDA1 family)